MNKLELVNTLKRCYQELRMHDTGAMSHFYMTETEEEICIIKVEEKVRDIINTICESYEDNYGLYLEPMLCQLKKSHKIFKDTKSLYYEGVATEEQLIESKDNLGLIIEKVCGLR